MSSAQYPPVLDFGVPIPATTRRSLSTSESSLSTSPAASFLTAFTSPAPFHTQEDAEGSVVLGHTLGRVIGHGAFSTIRLASSSSSNGVVAVKIVPNHHSQNHINNSIPLYLSKSLSTSSRINHHEEGRRRKRGRNEYSSTS